jgi:hypothetical protein
MAQHKFNFRLMTRDDSTAASRGRPDAETCCRNRDQRTGRSAAVPQVIFEPAGHSRDSTGGLEFGGMPYVRGAEFQEMGGPGRSSSRRGAGRERSAAVVEHRGILGKACRDGRLAARPARSGHLALGPVGIHRPASFTLFFARLLQNAPQVDHEPLR